MRTSMEFRAELHQALSGLFRDEGAQVIVDSVETLAEQDERVFLVDYHLEGRWASPAGFTFAFVESVPLETSLSAFQDFVARNWATAHLAPTSALATAPGQHGTI